MRQDLEPSRAAALRSARIAYAATDAWACRELYLRFQSLGLLRPKPHAQAARRRYCGIGFCPESVIQPRAMR